jgi:hypothetical protein
MPPLRVYAAFYAYHRFRLLLTNYQRTSLGPIGKLCLDSFDVGLVNFMHTVEHPQRSRRLLAAVMALQALHPHQLAGSGDFEPALGSLMRLHFWHYFVPPASSRRVRSCRNGPAR